MINVQNKREKNKHAAHQQTTELLAPDLGQAETYKMWRG